MLDGGRWIVDDTIHHTPSTNSKQPATTKNIPSITHTVNCIAHDVYVFINRVERNGISMFIYKKHASFTAGC